MLLKTPSIVCTFYCLNTKQQSYQNTKINHEAIASISSHWHSMSFDINTILRFQYLLALFKFFLYQQTLCNTIASFRSVISIILWLSTMNSFNRLFILQLCAKFSSLWKVSDRSFRSVGKSFAALPFDPHFFKKRKRSLFRMIELI